MSQLLANLQCVVQHYAWGKKGGSSAIAQMLAIQNKPVDESKPYAEWWMGTHPSGPSSVVNEDGSTTPLSDLLDQPVPYILKVLSINECLSIQAHPDKTLAAKLHAEKPDMYKDPNHKPEMALAVTEFEAMCGFRPLAQIADFLNTVPEFRALVGESLAAGFEQAVKESKEPKSALVSLFTRVMTIDEATLTTQLNTLVSRMKQKQTEQAKEKEKEEKKNGEFVRHLDVEELVVRLHAQHGVDVGVFAPFLLNCFRCVPGEAVFLPANEPHAYLSGDIIESMACSDNVVRAGCTPKARDTDVLCSMLTYEARLPDVMSGDVIDKHTSFYRCPVPEFLLSRTVLPASAGAYSLSAMRGPTVAIVYQGEGKISSGSTTLSVKAGSILLLPDSDVTLESSGDKELVMFRCSPNHEHESS